MRDEKKRSKASNDTLLSASDITFISFGFNSQRIESTEQRQIA